MATKGVSGPGIAIAGTGAFLIYIGIKGTRPLEELRSLVRGTKPTPLAKTSKFQPIASGQSSGTSAGGDIASRAAQIAQQQIGVPYRWGGTDPRRFDCSRLVFYSFTHAGARAQGFPRSTAAEILSPLFKKVSRAQIAAGDLTWWPGHVGIAISNSQGGYAPR